MKPKKKAILSLEAWPMLDDLTQQSENEAQLRTELDDLTRQRNDIVVRKRQLSQEMEKLDQKGVEVDTSITWLKEVIRQERKKVIDEDGVMIVESRRDTHLVGTSSSRRAAQGWHWGATDLNVSSHMTPSLKKNHSTAACRRFTGPGPSRGRCRLLHGQEARSS